MTDIASIWHELGSAGDIVNMWNNVVSTNRFLGNTFLWNQGVPDRTIGTVGGQANGSTCWHAVCYGWTNLGASYQVANNLVIFHAFGIGGAPSSITGLTGVDVFHVADNVYFNVFPMMNKVGF